MAEPNPFNNSPTEEDSPMQDDYDPTKEPVAADNPYSLHYRGNEGESTGEDYAPMDLFVPEEEEQLKSSPRLSPEVNTSVQRLLAQAHANSEGDRLWPEGRQAAKRTHRSRSRSRRQDSSKYSTTIGPNSKNSLFIGGGSSTDEGSGSAEDIHNRSWTNQTIEIVPPPMPQEEVVLPHGRYDTSLAGNVLPPPTLMMPKGAVVVQPVVQKTARDMSQADEGRLAALKVMSEGEQRRMSSVCGNVLPGQALHQPLPGCSDPSYRPPSRTSANVLPPPRTSFSPNNNSPADVQQHRPVWKHKEGMPRGPPPRLPAPNMKADRHHRPIASIMQARMDEVVQSPTNSRLDALCGNVLPPSIRSPNSSDMNIISPISDRSRIEAKRRAGVLNAQPPAPLAHCAGNVLPPPVLCGNVLPPGVEGTVVEVVKSQPLKGKGKKGKRDQPAEKPKYTLEEEQLEEVYTGRNLGFGDIDDSGAGGGSRREACYASVGLGFGHIGSEDNLTKSSSSACSGGALNYSAFDFGGGSSSTITFPGGKAANSKGGENGAKGKGKGKYSSKGRKKGEKKSSR